MRTLLISDVHGCYDELVELLSLVGYEKYKDKLIILGDIVDRGPKTLEVLDFCIGNSDTVEVLMGNHDRMLLDAIKSYRINSVKKINPKSSIGLLLSRGEEYLHMVENYLEGLKYYKELCNRTILVHGGMLRGRAVSEQDKLDMILARPIDKGYNEIDGYTFIVGHTPTIALKQGNDTIIRNKNTIHIDCGCVHGGNLCCYWLEGDTAYYVKGKQYA